jgi:hypothetical protein
MPGLCSVWVSLFFMHFYQGKYGRSKEGLGKRLCNMQHGAMVIPVEQHGSTKTKDFPMATTTATKAAVKTNKVNKFGSQRHNARRKVVRMRTKDLMSWAAIADAIEASPRTARLLFQEARGEGQHHDHLEGKGGRFPAQSTTVDAVAPFLPGDGTNNAWTKFFAA